MTQTRADALARDADDPLAFARARFALPEGVIYLDGNSLGALPRRTAARVADTVTREWGEGLIRSWNDAGWIDAPAKVGGRIARLIGAQTGEVIVADSTSINVFKLAAAALALRPGRRTIVTEAGNFPTDLYMLEGLAKLNGIAVRAVAADALNAALDGDTALLWLTHVHYRSGAVHDMAALTAAAHAAGALAGWDLSHSAGALAVDLNGADADLATGCGYKYLNGGPGAPAYAFVARRHHAALDQPLTGWMGHAAPFDFAEAYRPGAGVARLLCGTPGIIGLAALASGVATFDGIDMGRRASQVARARRPVPRARRRDMPRRRRRLPAFGARRAGQPDASPRRGGDAGADRAQRHRRRAAPGCAALRLSGALHTLRRCLGCGGGARRGAGDRSLARPALRHAARGRIAAAQRSRVSPSAASATLRSFGSTGG